MSRDWIVRALRTIDRRAVYAGRRVNLRDAAVLALLAAGMTLREISAATADQIHQNDDTGALYVLRPRRAQRVEITRLTPLQSEILLEYTEAERNFGERVPLFTGSRARPLSMQRLQQIETKWRLSA